MGTSVATHRATCHARSISLPSRTQPHTASVEEIFCKLKTTAATSLCSPRSVCHNLSVLIDLYEHLDDSLQLPSTQPALSCKRNGKSVEEVLEGSLGLLDVCGTIKDVLSLMKESVQEVESSIQRRSGVSSDQNEVQKFMISRKKLNELVRKCLGDLKKMQKYGNSAVLIKDHDDVPMIHMLREVEAVSLSVFKSILSLVSGTKEKSRQNVWSLVSRLMPSKRVTSEGDVDSDEVKSIEVALDALNKLKSSKHIDIAQVQNMHKRLETFELSIRELEDELECLFRHLIKTRVSLLNILNHYISHRIFEISQSVHPMASIVFEWNCLRNH